MKTLNVPTADATQRHRVSATCLRHRFGDIEALRDLSFSVDTGEILCLVGPSGCGKSTLLRLVAGLERVQEGAIVLDGEVIGDRAKHVLPEARGIGLVFQDFALFPHMSILENVAFGLVAPSRAERLKAALDMLRRVGLADRWEDSPHLLSGGQQQRVAVARALAPRPRVMLLDEPFSNLDVRLRHRMRVDTLQLLKESQTAAILVTHDPEEAMYMADRIALMQNGTIVQIGAPADLYRHPVSPFAAEFFGDVNRLRGVVYQGQVITPLGAVHAQALKNGAEAEVLIRPEAIVPGGGEPTSVQTRIVSVRILGANCMVTLEVTSRDGVTTSVQAQVPSAFCGPHERSLMVRLDPQGVFVFPVC